MNFSKQLNDYIEKIDCTSKELAEKSNISTPVISRFRNGKKLPNIKSGQLKQLSNGLYVLMVEKSLEDGITEDNIYNSLLETLDDDIDVEILRRNFNELINTLNLNVSALSYDMGFSPSLVSKIKSGQRTPYKPKEFLDALATYIVKNFNLAEERKAVALLINENLDNITDDIYFEKVCNWIAYNTTSSTNYIDNFLSNLDNFNLDQYIKSIHFDDMKVPFVPFYKSTSKTYIGIEERKNAQLDFFKATVLSKSKEPIFMCNDMPMEDLGSDIEFGKKWMYAIALSLKKGLHINIIHNINRPFNEMMLGLESWIPIYMTGQVSPYYFKNFQDNVYHHLDYVSGNVALTGECTKNSQDKTKCILYNSKSDLKYYKGKAKDLLNIAEPLMEIYREDEKNQFYSFLMQDAKIDGIRRRKLPSLPVHTIYDNLLLKILKRNNVPENEIKQIMKSVKTEKEIAKTILEKNQIFDEIDEISKDKFDETPELLFLANHFVKSQITYTYDEYIEHLEQTLEFEKSEPNYVFKTNSPNAFKNIQIFIHEKNYVMISKNTNPAIHFVIHHPKLRSAIESFVPPILEE